MPKRQARPRARRKIDLIDWINLEVILAVGPRCGSHTDAGPRCEAEAVRLARLWHEYREDILAEGSRPEWAIAVLEEGREGPFEPDPPYAYDSYPEGFSIEEAREHELHLDEVARDTYRSLSE
jgi:hypothetical protein